MAEKLFDMFWPCIRLTLFKCTDDGYFIARWDWADQWLENIE